MKCPVDIESLYNDYIVAKNEENFKERYEGKENYYHASGGGSCSRRLYFETIEKAESTNPTNQDSNRILRLGTIVHEDFELCLRKLQGKRTFEKEFKKDDSPDTTIYSNTIHSDTIHSKEKEIHYLEKESFEFHIEKEIILPVVNKSNHSHYLDYYDKGAFAIVNEKYKEDFKKYNYRMITN